jgi:hypothetical protein
MALFENLQELMVKYRFRPEKKLSQFFCTRSTLLETMVDKASLNSKDVVLEIGPGTGFMTRLLLNKSGKVIDRMYDAHRQHSSISNSYYTIRSDVKTLIIPEPGQLNECLTRFYIISLADPAKYPSTHSEPPEPYYSILDLKETFDSPHANGKLVPFDFGESTAKKIQIPPAFPFGPNNDLHVPFTPHSGLSEYNMHMNAVSIPGSQDYLLVISHITDIFFYRISSTGISYISAYSDYHFEGMSIVNGSDVWMLFHNQGATLASELEIKFMVNGNIRIA